MNKLYVWGNYHCSNISGFQDIFNELIEQCTIFPRPLFHQIDTLDKTSIAELSFNLTPDPAVLIVIAGDESLKNYELICDLKDNFNTLLNSLTRFSNIKIVTCGLIPEKQASIHSQYQSKSANHQIGLIHAQYNQMFIQTDGFFNSLDFRSRECLNQKGSRKLARLIVTYLSTKFSNYFTIINI
jgi:hypothetical protein